MPLKPGILISLSDHVSVKNMKSVFIILSVKSLIFVLSPRTLCDRPWMFHVLKDRLWGIFVKICVKYLVEKDL
jgi:hypothetical protein